MKRTLFPIVPPRVDYELTPLGLTLIKPIKALLAWTIENRAAMAETRLAYAKASKRQPQASTMLAPTRRREDHGTHGAADSGPPWQAAQNAAPGDRHRIRGVICSESNTHVPRSSADRGESGSA